MRWAANERKRQRLVQQRTVQQVVADIAKLVPELGGGAAPRPGEGEYYLHEPDGDKVMDHAAMAYRNGDMDQARRIYDYHARGDQESVFQGDVVSLASKSPSSRRNSSATRASLKDSLAWLLCGLARHASRTQPRRRAGVSSTRGGESGEADLSMCAAISSGASPDFWRSSPWCSTASG